MNRIFIHIEGFAVLLLSLYVYAAYDFNWLWFLIFLFTPDLSMLGYMINPRVGAITYNVIHTYSLAIVLLLIGLIIGNANILAAGLILTAHIGMDRMFGFGLKYPTSFKETHLQRI